MEVNQKKEMGTLNISQAVIENIAKVVVDEVEGVYSMAPSPSRIKDIVIPSQKNNPIRTSLSAGVAQINVYLTLKYGYKLKDVAEEVQDCVKDAVQTMTGTAVSKVNVYVQDIHLDEQD